MNKDNYSREDEQPKPWPVAALCRQPSPALQGFAPAAAFGVYERSRKGGPPATVPLPPYVLLSRNHSDVAWAGKAPRRLKNVIVSMEWVPDPAALRRLRAEAISGSASDEDALAAAFALLDSDGDGRLGLPIVPPREVSAPRTIAAGDPPSSAEALACDRCGTVVETATAQPVPPCPACEGELWVIVR